MRERRVAASDAEDETARRRHLERHGRGCRDRRVPCHRVRHRRAETQSPGLTGRERETDPRIAGEVLRVDDGETVEARLLGPRRRPLDCARPCDAGGPDFRARHARTLEFPYGRHRAEDQRPAPRSG